MSAGQRDSFHNNSAQFRHPQDPAVPRFSKAEDAQPNLEEARHLRPPSYVIGRREPDPAPPRVRSSDYNVPPANAPRGPAADRRQYGEYGQDRGYSARPMPPPQGRGYYGNRTWEARRDDHNGRNGQIHHQHTNVTQDSIPDYQSRRERLDSNNSTTSNRVPSASIGDTSHMGQSQRQSQERSAGGLQSATLLKSVQELRSSSTQNASARGSPATPARPTERIDAPRPLFHSASPEEAKRPIEDHVKAAANGNVAEMSRKRSVSPERRQQSKSGTNTPGTTISLLSSGEEEASETHLREAIRSSQKDKEKGRRPVPARKPSESSRAPGKERLQADQVRKTSGNQAYVETTNSDEEESRRRGGSPVSLRSSTNGEKQSSAPDRPSTIARPPTKRKASGKINIDAPRPFNTSLDVIEAELELSDRQDQLNSLGDDPLETRLLYDDLARIRERRRSAVSEATEKSFEEQGVSLSSEQDRRDRATERDRARAKQQAEAEEATALRKRQEREAARRQKDEAVAEQTRREEAEAARREAREREARKRQRDEEAARRKEAERKTAEAARKADEHRQRKESNRDEARRRKDSASSTSTVGQSHSRAPSTASLPPKPVNTHSAALPPSRKPVASASAPTSLPAKPAFPLPAIVPSPPKRSANLRRHVLHYSPAYWKYVTENGAEHGALLQDHERDVEKRRLESAGLNVSLDISSGRPVFETWPKQQDTPLPSIGEYSPDEMLHHYYYGAKVTSFYQRVKHRDACPPGRREDRARQTIPTLKNARNQVSVVALLETVSIFDIQVTGDGIQEAQPDGPVVSRQQSSGRSASKASEGAPPPKAALDKASLRTPSSVTPKPNGIIEELSVVYPLPKELIGSAADKREPAFKAARLRFEDEKCEELELQYGMPITTSDCIHRAGTLRICFNLSPVKENETAFLIPENCRNSARESAGYSSRREAFKNRQVAEQGKLDRIAESTSWSRCYLVLRFAPVRFVENSPLNVDAGGSGIATAPRSSRPRTPPTDMPPPPPKRTKTSETAGQSGIQPKREPGTPPLPKPLARAVDRAVRFPLNIRPASASAEYTRNQAWAFLENYHFRFEGQRQQLLDIYTPHATFSYLNFHEPAKRLTRNNTRNHDVVAFGQYQVYNYVKKLPVTTWLRKDDTKFVYDAMRIGGTGESPLSITPILISLHGEMMQFDTHTKFSFDRTFYIVPTTELNSFANAAGLPYAIQSDTFIVRPLADPKAWKPDSLQLRPPEPAPSSSSARRPFVREQSIFLPHPSLEPHAYERALDAVPSDTNGGEGAPASTPRTSSVRAPKPPLSANARGKRPIVEIESSDDELSIPASPRHSAPSSRQTSTPTALEQETRTLRARLDAATREASVAPANTDGQAALEEKVEVLQKRLETLEAERAQEIRERASLRRESAANRPGSSQASTVGSEMRTKQKIASQSPADNEFAVPRASSSKSHEYESTALDQKRGSSNTAKKKQKRDASRDTPNDVSAAIPEQGTSRQRPTWTKQPPIGAGPSTSQSHGMNSTPYKARSMDYSAALGGYLAFNVRGDMYYWNKNNRNFTCKLSDAGSLKDIGVDASAWSEEHQTAVVGYYKTSGTTNPRMADGPDRQLVTIPVTEREVGRINDGRIRELPRTVLRDTPHKGHGINALCIIPNSRDLRVATAGNDRTMAIWSIPKNGGRVRVDTFNTMHTSNVRSIVWDDRRRRLLSCGSDKKIMCIDARKETVTDHWMDDSPINHLILHPERHDLAVLCFQSHQDQFRLVDLRTPSKKTGNNFGYKLLTEAGKSKALPRAQYGDMRGDLFAFAADDAGVRIWDLRKTTSSKLLSVGIAGALQPYFESDRSMATLGKKHFTATNYHYDWST